MRSYAYDALGNMVEYTDRNGSVVAYQYDALGRETAENWLDSAENVIYSIAYEYDALGRLLSTGDSDATFYYQYSYDALGRVDAKTESLDANSIVVVFDYAYDVAGNLTQTRLHHRRRRRLRHRLRLRRPGPVRHEDRIAGRRDDGRHLGTYPLFPSWPNGLAHLGDNLIEVGIGVGQKSLHAGA